MNTMHFLTRRDDDGEDSAMNPTMAKLLIALMVLVIIAILAVVALLVLRNIRRSRKEAELPLYNEKRTSTASHRLTITTSTSENGRPDSIYVYNEKQTLMEKNSNPPDSPVPEIRITFPEEYDDSGKRQSGRVVVVRVGETSIGLEPLQEDLPPYQRDTNERFQSLDLNRIGGLKEKDIAV